MLTRYAMEAWSGGTALRISTLAPDRGECQLHAPAAFFLRTIYGAHMMGTWQTPEWLWMSERGEHCSPYHKSNTGLQIRSQPLYWLKIF
jgi:hypothetical protein